MYNDEKNLIGTKEENIGEEETIEAKKDKKRNEVDMYSIEMETSLRSYNKEEWKKIEENQSFYGMLYTSILLSPLTVFPFLITNSSAFVIADMLEKESKEKDSLPRAGWEKKLDVIYST
jgi:hypothetical protein